MFRHDPQRSGYSISDAPNTNKTSWIYNSTYEIASSPAIADGKLIVIQSNGEVIALSTATGNIIWTYATNSAADLVWSSPAIDSGKVYVGTPDGNLYCLDASTGSMKWAFKTSGSIDSSPLVKDGMVYFTSEDGRLYCLDSTTGLFYWKTQVLSSSGIFASVAYSNNLFYVACKDGMVYGITTYNGNSSIRWATSIRLPVTSSPTVSGNSLYLGSGAKSFDNGTSYTGKIICFNASGPQVFWSTQTSENNLEILYSSPAIADGRLFIGSNAGNFYCLDASTGATLWSVQTGRQIVCSPAVADGKVFFGCGGKGTIYCVSEYTGAVEWSYETESRCLSSPAVSNGVVYICSGFSVYAFGSSDPIPSSTPAPTSTTSTSPASLEASTATLQAKTDNDRTVNLTINGNITSSQISNVTYATDEAAKSTTISFTVTGETGTVGFSNITIPKKEVTSGGAPAIYIDDAMAQNQGYTQNAQNYYVWFTTHFSTHKISIVFTADAESMSVPSVSPGHAEAEFSWLQVFYGVAVAAVIVVVVVVGLLLFVRGKRVARARLTE